MDLIETIRAIPGAGPFLPWITLLVSLCAAVATVLTKPTKPGWYAALHGAVNAIGLNFGRAKNK